ncbi:TetR/AcrR family transcriptional regulator [Actinocorallia longicatena]|uniref:TetR/AcrR family transcriptional regulator n=1 Tax=Actinocorallia longicatena TaxID=111803 RepID=A0ABP6Q915_9ACTN
MATEQATGQRLVLAAERLFAERGIGAVSLRAVMQEADTNVAAVHYHFGSKEALLAAVVRGRIGQVTSRRDALLEALPDGERADPRSLALAFVRPLFDVVVDGGGHWVSVIGQLLAAGDPALAPIADTFLERNARFVALMERLEPRPSMDTIAFRLIQAMSLTLHVLGDVGRTRAVLGGDPSHWSIDHITDQLVDVVTSVIAGPPR